MPPRLAVVFKPLTAAQSIGEAAASMAADAVGQIDTGWQQLLDDGDPEGPHQLRIGLRKLRVILHVFRDADGSDQAAKLHQSLVALARSVGELRDIDVLSGEIVAPVMTAEPVPGGAELAAKLEAERKAVRASVRRKLNGKAARALRIGLKKLPKQLGARLAETHSGKKIGKRAQRDLRKRWHKLEQRGEHLETATVEELHEFRKALKNLRYAFGYFASLWDEKPAAQFETELRRLQSTFGYLNDVAGAKALQARLSLAPAEADLNCAIGFVLGWHSERALHARTRINEEWQDLAATKIARELARAVKA